MAREDITDDELLGLIGEAACASRPAPEQETLAEYLERIAKEDSSSIAKAAVGGKPSNAASHVGR